MVDAATLQPAGSLDQEAEIRSLTSSILQRYQFLRQAGITFGGKRDLYELLGYKRVLFSTDYRDRYSRDGLAKRVVEVMPNAAWRGDMEIVEDLDSKSDTPFEKEWKALATRLKVHAVLRRANILSRLSTYAVVLIGAPGDLGQELPRAKNSSASLLYLTPFCGSGGPNGINKNQNPSGANFVDATITKVETDASNPRYGLPLEYQLRRVDSTDPAFGRPIHWTRVHHIAEGCLDSDIYGSPDLEPVWNLFDDLAKVTGGGAEAFWLRSNGGMQIDLDKDVNLEPDELAAMQTQMEEYSNEIRRTIRTRGIKMNRLGSDVADFSSPSDTIITQIAGTKSIPKRILTGSEMGQLASSEDRENWKDQVNGYQTQHLTPYVIRPLVDRLVSYGYLPTPSGGSLVYEVKWPHVQTLTEQERADGAAKWAQVNATAGFTVFTSDEIRQHWYGIEPVEEVITDDWRATLALKMASVNKSQGSIVFTSAEIRDTCYGWTPLSPEEEKPIAAPEKISVDGGTEPPSTPVALTASEDEMAEILRAAIEAGNKDVVLEILNLNEAEADA